MHGSAGTTTTMERNMTTTRDFLLNTFQGYVLKNFLFVPLQTLEHPEVQKAEINYVLGFLCPSHLSCSRKDLAEK
jgi:hypothetical protein